MYNEWSWGSFVNSAQVKGPFSSWRCSLSLSLSLFLSFRTICVCVYMCPVSFSCILLSVVLCVSSFVASICLWWWCMFLSWSLRSSSFSLTHQFSVLGEWWHDVTRIYRRKNKTNLTPTSLLQRATQHPAFSIQHSAFSILHPASTCTSRATTKTFAIAIQWILVKGNSDGEWEKVAFNWWLPLAREDGNVSEMF